MRSIGMILLGAWLILSGLIGIIDLHFDGLPLIMNILALAAGVLIILKR